MKLAGRCPGRSGRTEKLAVDERAKASTDGRRGFGSDVLLAGSGISAEALTNPKLYVEAYEEAAVMRNLLQALDNRAGLGIEVGREYHLTA